ncbi:MAG: SBBP repeat-containing protein [Bacteroidetes bacterium]|nr:SBBP repeat-containing protein [Bacteroidota bacterium]
MLSKKCFKYFLLYIQKILISLSFLITLTQIVCAQVNQEWVSLYDRTGNGNLGIIAMKTDNAGNIYITGATYFTQFSPDYVTIKYNSAGVQQWTATYNGPGNFNDEPSSIAIDLAGNVYVTGGSYGNNSNYDYATIKYNSSGVEQWVARYNGSGNNIDEATSIAVDNSGSVYVTGWSRGSNSNDDYVTIKYNSSGVQQWVALYNGPANSSDQASSLIVDQSGNIYVTGGSVTSGKFVDCVTIKYNSAGVQQWRAVYDGAVNQPETGKFVGLDIAGNVYVTGSSFDTTTGPDILTIKYNSSGIEQWVRKYNRTGNMIDEAAGMVVDGLGNTYITGNSVDDYITLKYNSAGVQQWASFYNGTGNFIDEAKSIATDKIGNVYVTGESLLTGSTSEFATLKYNSNGTQQWIKKYSGTGMFFNRVPILSADTSGNVVISGISNGINNSSYYTTIKYSQFVGISPVSSNLPSGFSLSQNYPNPFNPSTKINFSLPFKTLVKLSVFNSLGKEVSSLVNENLPAGNYEYQFNAENYPSGIFFYKLETESFTETRKMILLK